MKQKRIEYKAIGNPKRSYRQKHFVFSTFNISGNSYEEMETPLIEKSLKKLKKLGLTNIELAWSTHNTGQKALEICQRENIDVIWQDMSLFGGFQNKIHRDTTEEEVKKLVEDTKNNESIIGYYIWDEPWADEYIEAAGQQTDWFDKYAPGKIAFSAMNPSYNPDYTWKNELYPEYIEHFLDTVNPSVGSFDYYPFGIAPVTEYGGEQLDNSNLWKDMETVRRACLKRDIPFWFYIQMVKMVDFPKFHFSMIRLQISYAIMYGAKAIQCYGIAGSKGSAVGVMGEKRRVLEYDYEEGCFYDDLIQIIKNVKNIGKTLMALNSKHIYHSAEVLAEDEYFNKNQREDISESSVFAADELPYRCSVGVFEDDYQNTYIAVLNRDYEAARSFVLPLNEQSRIYEVSKADGKQYCVNNSADRIYVTLEAGDMALYRLQRAADEAFDIEYKCI